MTSPKSASPNLLTDDRGAIVLMGVFMSAFLVGGLWYLMGVGDAIIYRETVQSAADATAYTAAVYHARGMNVIAMLNITIGAVMAIAAAATVLAQIAAMIVSFVNTLCDMYNNPGVDSTTGEPLNYSHLAFSCDLLEESAELMKKMEDVVAAVEKDTGSMLASLSDAQKEVAETAPWLGASQSASIAAMHAPYVEGGGSGSPSMMPKGERIGLPVEEEPFEEACKRGQSVVGKLITLLVPASLDPILDMMNLGFAALLPKSICAGNFSGGGMGLISQDDWFNEDDVCDDVVGGGPPGGSPPGGGGDDGDDGDDGGGDPKEDCEDDLDDKKKKHKPKKYKFVIDLDELSTKGPFADAENGNDYMQVYSVVRGVVGDDTHLERSDKGVEIAAWSQTEAESAGSLYEDYGVAQAEFYYDQTTDAIAEDGCWDPCPAGLTWPSYANNTLWNLRWRARLRRYREPQSADPNVMTEPVINTVGASYTDGVDSYYNPAVGMGPTLIDSTVVADKTGAGAFIGGPALLH